MSGFLTLWHSEDVLCRDRDSETANMGIRGEKDEKKEEKMRGKEES